MQLILQALKKVNRWQDAESMYDVFRKAQWDSEPLMPWQDVSHTPMIYVPGLREKPFWTAEEDPYLSLVSGILEANFAALREELQTFLDHVPWARNEEFNTKDSLVNGGAWRRWSVFYNRKWDERLCLHLPTACRMLRGVIDGPDRMKLHLVGNNDDEVVMFETEPGTEVLWHNGGRNTRLNVHMGLDGVEGSVINVRPGGGAAPVKLRWQEGRVGPIFEDGFDHEVRTPKASRGRGSKPRLVIAIGCLHPDLVKKPHLYAQAWTRKTEFAEWDQKAHVEYEAAAARATALNGDGRHDKRRGVSRARRRPRGSVAP
eukprot:gnl/TRDRNA2_/TRDRNA2_167827_c0_seq1.p1 gnl/TRDRNA2_/TRDRNA2_167827_c0~~gnl/TRDRNA2_/TRDRNA2_167827_c0_seq1.p1  ORF type:complete len:316 (+),score=63.89 gnl/TRDRNA2_/TRDRNA2_167827_c0_seq1:200-1147(+)